MSIDHLANAHGVKMHPASGIPIPPHNSCEQTIVGATCTFVYKLNGATVFTLNVVYTDATLQTFSSYTFS